MSPRGLEEVGVLPTPVDDGEDTSVCLRQDPDFGCLRCWVQKGCTVLRSRRMRRRVLLELSVRLRMSSTLGGKSDFFQLPVGGLDTYDHEASVSLRRYSWDGSMAPGYHALARGLRRLLRA